MSKPKKKIKVHSLTGRITIDLMQKAWKAVRRNRGAAGVDKVSIDMYEANLQQNLESLMRKLKTRSYIPKPLKRKWIPKGPGKNAKLRPLGIPTVECRVAQEVVRRLINNIFERKFHDNSFGFRPGRGCHHAAARVQSYLSKGYKYIVDADIKGFFDNIPHKLIVDELSSEIADGNILGLVERFLTAGVMEDGKLHPTTRGTPQGGVISPLLANAVLNQLDHKLEEKGYKFVRYADDFVIMCRTKRQAESALDFATGVIEEELQLELSKEKTHISQAKDGFDFLGFTITSRKFTMREKSMEKFKTKVKDVTKRSHNLDQKCIKKLNQILRGTVNYFTTPRTPARPWIELDQWIRRRLRNMKKKRISKMDNIRLKNSVFNRLGLLNCQAHFQRVKKRQCYSQPWVTV